MHYRDIDFVIIGAAKSATTWLQRQLQLDSGVYMPDPELHYFSRHYNRDDAWYLSHFVNGDPSVVVGEKSNSYLYEPEAAARIHRHMPQVKLIVQLRNPVQRAYSNYCMLFRRGDVGGDIAHYIDPSVSEDKRFLKAGQFAPYLQNYIDLFGREALLILFFEGVAQAPQAQLNRARVHLGLPPAMLTTTAQSKVKDKTVPIIPARLSKSLKWLKPVVRPLRGTGAFEAIRAMVAREPQHPPLTDDLRRRLVDYYRPSIESLEKMSGQSLSHWYAPVQ